MPSPDLREYLDLTLFDLLPYELVERMLDLVAARTPEFQPKAGTQEMVLIEALAVAVAELGYQVNRLPGAVMDVLLRFLDIVRDIGAPPTATVRFTFAGTLGYEVPAGTRLRLAVGPEFIEFTTDVTVNSDVGQATVDVDITGTANTADANGVLAGTPLAVVSAIPFVDGAELITDVAAGADPELVSDWRNRAVQRFSRLNETLARPHHFEAAALEYVTVHRARGLDSYDPGQAGVPGDHLGHMTVAVAGQAGALLSAEDKDTLTGILDDGAVPMLIAHVIDAAIVPVDVTVTVAKFDGYTDAEVIANVTAALTSYLDPDEWDWSGVVRRNELIALVDGVDGVDYVDALAVPAADLNLAGVATLATAGNLTVNVI